MDEEELALRLSERPDEMNEDPLDTLDEDIDTIGLDD